MINKEKANSTQSDITLCLVTLAVILSLYTTTNPYLYIHTSLYAKWAALLDYLSNPQIVMPMQDYLYMFVKPIEKN